jgi:hypothetical protein
VIRFCGEVGLACPRGLGWWYQVLFQPEYIDDNYQVVAKSDGFVRLTEKLVGWLADHFVTSRGKDCYDNPEEFRRLFGGA